ncbi:M48 family metallopeptidase [candidate division TA06 bacterium]|nr:M48 family metallopeptidase [candidate division TA06 bacterium]
MEHIVLGDISIDVVQKHIKNVHLSVYPPAGRVRISAPLRMDLETIKMFAISKMGWIKKKQLKIRSQQRETPREYLSRESHFFLGKRYLLKVVEADAKPAVTIQHETLLLQVRKGTSLEQKHIILQDWQRQQLRDIIPTFISIWEEKLNVTVAEFGIKKMRTRWGTCNRKVGRIWINLELARKPLECLEYIIVHEMVHLLERNHNEVFVALMDKHLPSWRQSKEKLNRMPISHTEWNY